MEDLLRRTWEELTGRDNGPLFFRLILQPAVAAILALRAGWNDARKGRRAFLWALVREPRKRRHLLRNAWKHIGRLFLLGVGLDVIYQLIVFHTVHPTQALIVATVLAAIPYLVVRGLTNRVVSRLRKVRDQGPASSD